MLSTELTRTFGLKHPVVSAPMANWSGGVLAGAVSAGGGLGMIGVGSTTPKSWIAEQANLARPHGPFGIGLLIWVLEARPELLDAALNAHPSAISVHAGDPTPYVARIKEAGAKVFCQVNNGNSAERATEAGVDFLVAQGTDAGGHTGSVGTMPLLQRVLEVGEAAGLPVLAAGGLATGRALAGVLAMGAVGAWVGTRFCATEESMGAEGAKRRILEADETQTVHTRVFDIVQGFPWPEEFPGRAISNAFSERWHGREEELVAGLATVRADFEEAQRNGDYSEANVYAGQAAGLVWDLPSAGELVGKLSAEAEACLSERCSTLLGGAS
jgi:nitronate monooxygenase